MLQLTYLIKKYNDHTVLNIPKFELQKGTYWLKGTNGSGKSTLLKIIASLIPFEGNIVLNGSSIAKNEVTYKNQISYCPADTNFPPFLNGLELIQFYDAIRNKGKTSQIEEIIQLFELAEFVKNKTGSYSSGMQKRLSLALAFIGNPSLILLDEPLSTLDTEKSALLSSIIAQKQQTGTSFIITLHQDFEYANITFTKKLLIANQTLQCI